MGIGHWEREFISEFLNLVCSLEHQGAINIPDAQAALPTVNAEPLAVGHGLQQPSCR